MSVYVSVLVGAFLDGNSIIPVQMEIKKSTDVGGRLYVTVAMTKIEAGVLGSTPEQSQTRSLMPACDYSLPELFGQINLQDKHFLKYVPDGFLSEEQKVATQSAIQEDANRIAGYQKTDSISAPMSPKRADPNNLGPVREDLDAQKPDFPIFPGRPSIVMPGTVRWTVPGIRIFGYEKRAKPELDSSMLALPIFPGSRPPSIVGAHELNFCVRDGNRWTLTAINTNLCRWLFTIVMLNRFRINLRHSSTFSCACQPFFSRTW